MTLFTLGHGSKQTIGSVSKRLKLPGLSFSEEEPKIKILQLQMLSPKSSLKLTGFRM